jgi:cation diffusion facilitator CzcD-associated flavoprotein CzcO
MGRQPTYPDRDQVLHHIARRWEQYALEKRTKFDTRVSKVYKDGSGKWFVNDTSNGHFDGIIVAIGTCGEPKIPHIPNRENHQGERRFTLHNWATNKQQAKD